jgi:Leucine-rich repeat (LRR) protein
MQLGNLSELKFLGLKGNRLQNLPPEIWTLYKLKHLWIGSNPIVSLPQEIYEMDDLEVLGICETGCSPENTEWVLGREVFLSSNTKSMMLVREKDEKLLERIKEELKVWN